MDLSRIAGRFIFLRERGVALFEDLAKPILS